MKMDATLEDVKLRESQSLCDNKTSTDTRVRFEYPFAMLPRRYRILALLGLVLLPLEASANAGTPLLWATMIHLVIGNAIIGIFEGIVLARFFGVPNGKAIGAMCWANYFSAWLGGLLIRGALLNVLKLDLTNGWRWFWIMVVLTFLLTLVLEWPFIAWQLRRDQDWIKRSFRASLVVQGSSYFLLFGWYWMASATSLYTQMQIVPSKDMSLPESVMVYFISSEDGDVYRRDLMGGSGQRIHPLQSTDPDDRLFARRNSVNTNRWDLLARLDSDVPQSPKVVEVLTNMNVLAPDEFISRDRPERTHFNFGTVHGLGSATQSRWEFHAGFWPMEGLRAYDRMNKDTRVQFSYETPFGAWAVRNAVILPSDKVLFQLGSDQICAFDPSTGRVALLWRGRGPVPIIELGK